MLSDLERQPLDVHVSAAFKSQSPELLALAYLRHCQKHADASTHAGIITTLSNYQQTHHLESLLEIDLTGLLAPEYQATYAQWRTNLLAEVVQAQHAAHAAPPQYQSPLPVAAVAKTINIHTCTVDEAIATTDSRVYPYLRIPRLEAELRNAAAVSDAAFHALAHQIASASHLPRPTREQIFRNLIDGELNKAAKTQPLRQDLVAPAYVTPKKHVLSPEFR